jgi:hypothetical protein
MEQVVMEVLAALEGAGGLGLGKLKVTTERLIFERRKMLGGKGDVRTFPLSSIHSAGISGILEKKLKVGAGSTELVFTGGLTGNGDANLRAISDLLQRSIAGQPLGTPMQTHDDIPAPVTPPPVAAGMESGSPLAAAPASESPGWISELERLATLHRAGELTDDEFARAKAKLLS